ncbi:MAG TPA: methylmalonyl Co-A mutase-associated GTPase MeaB [Polyangiaceae bacterium]|nr:methylmalonyl Co-A mutase-associated GTPase MeaB [Polyangiaceae bacterium]
MSAVNVRELALRVAAREPGAVARTISLVEDRRPSAEGTTVELLRALTEASDPFRAARIGITGPPGVGKSTLVSALAKAARASGRTVGVLAVDPSSPRSGGALLGDRARIEIDPADLGLFVRSMASGGELGGLARAASAAIDVLSAAYDVVLVETTGVGQSETDVEHVADTVLLVIQPGSGDVLQFLKAGIIEIPDVFAVNKGDLGGIAERALGELTAALAVAHSVNESDIPQVLLTSASTNAGVPELLAVLDGHRQGLVTAGKLRERRYRALAAAAFRLFVHRWGEQGVADVGGKTALLSRLERRVREGATAVEAMSEMRPR